MLGLRKQCLVRYTVSTFIKITNGAKDGKKNYVYMTVVISTSTGNLQLL